MPDQAVCVLIPAMDRFWPIYIFSRLEDTVHLIMYGLDSKVSTGFQCTEVCFRLFFLVLLRSQILSNIRERERDFFFVLRS